MTEKMTGAQILCEALVREDVEVMFGIPGGTIMPFFYAMHDYRDKIHHVLCRHEQGGGHAADGYARVSGKVGVCLGTSGPGSTNLVTAIANAYMDSVPIVAITAQVSSAVIGRDAFQETDITGITMPVTKHNYLVKKIDDIARVVKEAFYIARTGRPGPVLIDITKDALQASTVPNWDFKIDLPGYNPTSKVDMHVLRQAIELLRNAKKPLIMAGHGIIKAEASAELLQFAEKTGIPVTTTFLGVGSFPEDHPLSLGMPGMHGWVHVNRAIQECDLLLNIGGRFEDRVTGKVSTFAPHAQVIHVDIDPSEINKNVKATLALIGDAKQILQALVAEMPARDTKDWLKHIREMQTKYQPQQQYTRNQYQKRHAESDLMPHDVFAALTKIINERGNYRVVTDVGQNQMWAVQLIDWYRPKTHISSGGLGTMGFALPAALGVAVACPNDTVWVIAGDGGFQMTNQEMITIMQEGIKNIKVVIINNGYLGMVRQWQELFENKRYSGTPLTGPNFVKLAEAYGVRGITVKKLEEVEAAILEAYAHDGPILLDFHVEREVNVFPMVPQGNSIGEMITKDPQSEAEVAQESVLAAV